MYEGLLIKESLIDESLLDLIEVKNVEIWKTDNKVKYWTAITFKSDVKEFPYLLAQSLNDIMPWYVDFKYQNTKYIVLRNNVLTYTIGNNTEKEAVLSKCLELGIPDKQLDWLE